MLVKFINSKISSTTVCFQQDTNLKITYDPCSCNTAGVVANYVLSGSGELEKQQFSENEE